MKHRYRILKRHHYFTNTDSFWVQRSTRFMWFFTIFRNCMLDGTSYTCESYESALKYLNRFIKDELNGFPPEVENILMNDDYYGYFKPEIMYMTGARSTFFFEKLGNVLNSWLKPLLVIGILTLATIVWTVHHVTSMQAKQHANLVAQYEKISN